MSLFPLAASAIEKPFVPGWSGGGMGLKPFIGELWLIGAIVAVLLTPFFTVGPVEDYAAARTADTAAYGRFFQAMLVRGVYPPPSQFEARFLSAAHTDKQIDRTIAAARKAFREV